jgi:endonuclease/exonuclease/phosphatase family metal-dependent hydrolase
VRLVTWNVLADAYIRAEYYPRTDPRHLRHGARTHGVVDAIEASAGDVFCLQEVEPRLVTVARKRLAGWTVHYAGKVNKPDGVAILARPGVALTDVTPLAFSDGSGHVALLATVAVDGLAVRLATTHLRWDKPGTPFEQRWGVRQVQELGTQLRAPAILCGDLNFEPADPVYAALTGAGYFDPFAATNPATANPNGRAKRIDYVLHTAELRGTIETPLAVADDTPLPSDAMPSDHVPLAVELVRNTSLT